MTDRVRYLTVTLERDTRVDDVQEVVALLRMIRGVAAVELGKPVDATDYLAREEARRDIRARLLRALEPTEPPF